MWTTSLASPQTEAARAIVRASQHPAIRSSVSGAAALARRRARPLPQPRRRCLGEHTAEILARGRLRRRRDRRRRRRPQPSRRRSSVAASRGRHRLLLGGEAAGAVDAARVAPGRAAPRATCATRDQRVEVDAGLDALAVEQVEHVLGGDVAGRARRERAAAEAADRRVEDRRARLDRRPGAGDAGVARVVEVAADRDAEDRDALERAARTGRGVATPIVSARTTSPAPAATSRSARSATTPGSTSPSNGQPNETLIVAVEGRSATARIRSTRAAASSSDALPFRWLNVSVAASVTLTRSSGVAASRSQPRSFRTSPESSASTSPDRRDDLLRAGHLRHALGADEADRLDPRQPGRRQPPHELGANVRRERLRLVLEPVPRADVAERDAARGEATRTGAP